MKYKVVFKECFVLTSTIIKMDSQTMNFVCYKNPDLIDSPFIPGLVNAGTVEISIGKCLDKLLGFGGCTRWNPPVQIFKNGRCRPLDYVNRF